MIRDSVSSFIHAPLQSPRILPHESPIGFFISFPWMYTRTRRASWDEPRIGIPEVGAVDRVDRHAKSNSYGIRLTLDLTRPNL